MPSAAHNRGATPQWLKDGTPRRARVLLGCDCVSHRLRSTLTTRSSSLLVSLQNHLRQIVNLVPLQPLNNLSGYIITIFAGKAREIISGQESFPSRNVVIYSIPYSSKPATTLAERRVVIIPGSHTSKINPSHPTEMSIARNALFILFLPGNP